MNSRFFGAWLLESFEARRPDGTVTRPWGDEPLGMISWDASGYFAVQVGPRDAARANEYISFHGMASAPEGESGRITLTVRGTSAPARVNGDQVRDFLFRQSDLLQMQPPAAPDGTQSTFMWRRAAGPAETD